MPGPPTGHAPVPYRTAGAAPAAINNPAAAGSGLIRRIAGMASVREGFLDDARSTAVFSDCGRHRFRLSRRWNGKAGTIVFLMLNPSTATESTNDPTIGRCHRFAVGWNGGRRGGYVICNLFSLITPDRRRLELSRDRLRMQENDRHISEALRGASRLICAWGGSGPDRFVQLRARQVVELIRTGFPGEPECLDTNANGAPTHPLYQPADACPRVWQPGGYLNDAAVAGRKQP